MRELKFRVWSKPFQAWAKDLCLYLDNSEIGDVSECFHNIEDKDNYIIQQYTGLKDKNGKEIYEGDLINYTCVAGEGDYQKEINQEVFFEDGMFLFDRNALFSMGDSNFLKQSIEVVGNIFENPELLIA